MVVLLSGLAWFRLLVSFELIYHPWTSQGTGPWPNIGVVGTNTLGRETWPLVRTGVRRDVLQTRTILAQRYCGTYTVYALPGRSPSGDIKCSDSSKCASMLPIVQASFRSSPITSSLPLAYYSRPTQTVRDTSRSSKPTVI